MKNHRITGMLGLATIIINFLGLASNIKIWAFVVIGLAVSVISFREVIRIKIKEKTADENISDNDKPGSKDLFNSVKF